MAREDRVGAGADLIGVAGIDRFENCPDEFHPRRLNRRTRSVIVLPDDFGPMQRFAAVLTDADIEPDPLRPPLHCRPTCRTDSHQR